jgi:hypothetical protein
MTRPARRTTRPGRLGVTAALVAALLLAACSAPDEGSAGSTQQGGVIDRVAEAIEKAVAEARERRAENTGGEEGSQDADQPIRATANPNFDDAAYRSTIENTFGLLEQYWATQLPKLGGRYSDPRRYVYYRSDQGAGPACGGEAAPARNAFYCPDGDFIAWDESGLLIPYYVQAGDFAASFVLAHEFGHAMQVRLPRQETTSLLRELQADCFAGAWSGFVSDRGLLESGDLDEATLAVFSARDVPGTPWNDPRAHGSGFERTRAFSDGFESGPSACYPAPAQEWVLSRR